MMRRCTQKDAKAIAEVINQAAQAYRGVIPDDRWKEPYMPYDEVVAEIRAGVSFWAYLQYDAIAGVMGIQPVRDVTLIRHAYVVPASQRTGVGGRLLGRLLGEARGRVLVGTWADASWAIAFYEKHGFSLLDRGECERLLREYWDIPGRQVETSVVLQRAAQTGSIP